MVVPVNKVTELVSDFCMLSACLGCLYLLITCIAVLRFSRGRLPRSGSTPEPVTILKPLCGGEPDLPQRLASFCRQAYDGPIQIVCGVRHRLDPAVDAVTHLKACADKIDLVLRVDAHEHGCNRKISNLANMLASARHDTLVISDSDIEVDRHYLANVVAELQRPGVGAVTCLYHGMPMVGLSSQCCALAINTHFLPNAVAAVRSGLAQPCFGSTIALRRDTMQRIGGLQAFGDCLADDHAVGEAVRATGQEVAIPAFSVGHACFDASWRDLFLHELRAARTIKSIDPFGYYGAVITHPFPLALIAATLGTQDAWLLAVIALGCRGAICLCVEYAFRLPRQPYWLIPGREVMSFAVYLCGLLGTTVSWRGLSYRVNSHGRLTPEQN